MPPRVKFCGLTRAEDAAHAVRLGAGYVGVVFAGGPRHLSAERAADVLAPVPPGVRRVGVMADQPLAELRRLVRGAGLDVVQLHAARPAAELRRLREALAGDGAVELWAVVRVAGAALPLDFAAVRDAADAVLVDAAVPGVLGGSGVTVDWPALARALAAGERPRRLVLAGGLRPENVRRAIAELAPDVVDVSSGVERAPGQKDHARMTAFASAVLTSVISEPSEPIA